MSDKVISLISHRFGKDVAVELKKASKHKQTTLDEKNRAWLESFHRITGLILSSNNLTSLEKLEIIKEVHDEITSDTPKLSDT